MVQKKLRCLALAGTLSLLLTACVDQHPEENGTSVEREDTSTQTMAVQDEPQEERIIATSNATLWICDTLGLDLIAIPSTTGTVPERYQGLPGRRLPKPWRCWNRRT